MKYILPDVNRQPHLFLSHSSFDNEFVRKLANDLAVCEVDVWLDEWEIEPGDSIYKAINAGIESSQYVGLVISESFMKSKWVSEEVEAAFTKQIEKGKKIILPILLEEIQLPPLLNGKLHIPFFDFVDYYSSLTRLAGIIYGINLKILSQAINAKKPRSLNTTIDTLAYCGLDPYMIVPKDVFDEFKNLDGVKVADNKLLFTRIEKIFDTYSISDKAKFYLKRVWTGLNRDRYRSFLT